MRRSRRRQFRRLWQFPRDGRRLATGDRKGWVWVWDAGGGDPAQPFPFDAPALMPVPVYDDLGPIVDIAFSPDGSRVSVVNEERGHSAPVHVWDLAAAGAALAPAAHPLPDLNLGSTPRSLAYSPNGKELALGLVSGVIQVCDTDRGAQRYTLQGGQGSVVDLAFSPDGQRIAGAFSNGTATVWAVKRPTTGETPTASKLFELQGHTASVNSIAFSPEGARLATGSADGTVRLWDAATGREQIRLAEGPEGVTAVAFSVDGRRLAATSDAVRIYILPVDELFALAHERVSRSLTGEERTVFLIEAAPQPDSTSANGTPVALPAPEDTVRALAAARSRGDVDGVVSLFTKDGVFALNVSISDDYPVNPAHLRSFVVFHAIGMDGDLRFRRSACRLPKTRSSASSTIPSAAMPGTLNRFA